MAVADATLRNSIWAAEYLGLSILEDAELSCQTTRDNTWAFLDAVKAGEADLSFATPLTGLYGEYFASGDVIVSVTGSPDDDRVTITHEAQHWAGFGEPAETDEEVTALENAIRVAAAGCITFLREEEEEDDDEPGGGGDDPNGGGEETCTDYPPVTTTVPVWIPPGNCPSSDEAEGCDFENGLGPVAPGGPPGGVVTCGLDGITICPGRWGDQEVVLVKGYRVCTSN